jgi:site-specific DNA-cytosine methylase|nr:MAG TPA: cytosine DNA methyltransferase [Caudoviricetes sp.]
MAERPLYTLYKNLKAQNYDVPDDYNKFESALTRDGKGGADNRHAIYENLKAQNFDVPSTYERFYSALFEPRSRTSSRAKGGSVPMSAADRARFSAGAAAISASAQQTMNNAGRYNRLKQRKQKQQKDFGRVNLGTHQTPYGGDANNVVKDDFAYNPETGKAGAYVTSDNENVYSLPEAEQMQAILDKQNDAYQVAVDTGEIPSAFDVRDKNGNYDLQENIGKNGTYLTEEGAKKQFDKKLADAYARKKEIEALIAEDNRQHGNPLLSYGASIGASNGRTAEQSDYRNKLATSLSLVTEQIGALEAVKQYPTSSWGEDALKALDNTAFTSKTWDFGLTDFAIMGQMERIKTKMDNNIPLSSSDKMLLKSKLGADAATALEDEKMGNVYRWTKIAGQSLPFMADFFLTGGYGGITKGISRGALKFAAKRGMGKVSAAILKNTGIVAGDVIGSYAMAGTEQALKTGADIMQRHLGNLYQDEKGDYKFGTFDENGNLLHEGGESIGTALYKGMTSAMVENYTEKLFGHNYGIKKGAVNFMEKHGMNASAEFFKNIGKSGWYTNSKKWMEKFGINGFAEEVMEEEIGIPLHALLDGEGKVSDLLDAKQQLDIIGGMAISVGSMYAMGAGSRPVKGIYNRAQYYRFRNKVNVADNDAQNLMGDSWADIKDKIDNATNEQMGGVLADILRQRDTMTKEQINAAVNYGVNLMKMRGYNIAKTAEMNAREITNEPTTPEEQHQADIDNAYSEGHDADDADKHDIQIQQEDQMNTLAAALGISEQQLSAMSDEELESLTGQDDKLDQAIYDYQLSSARYQGVVDDAQDKVDLAAHQAEQRVDMYTDQSRGSVRNATIKASGGLEDYGVYIISGNIATHDDGSIDVSNSDDMILYYDPTTNSVEHADALMFAELGEELPADDVKAQAVADAKENAIKEVAGIIDGTVEVGSQFNVTDTDGTEHTYEVLADYGDGTAAISIDGNVVENPYSLADLQQMKDLEDQKRLEAAKAEREQMEKERAAQQTQETEETQPSFDFNQILNDNGNVVLVDVLDKDGNTKYPDSRLFLIRDAGAKAKVVELKSDGTIVPHAVSKEDVATISSMSLDEYKQAMPESSMIEDNSGEESDEDSQLENLGLPKGSEIWMSGDGFGRPKENTLSKVVGIDEQGSIILEDKDGKKWSASFDYINNHRELAPLDENANIVNEENNQVEANAEENTPAPEQTPAITLEDGTEVPMLEDGNPDFSKLTAAQTAELYDSQFGEDADSVISGWVSDAKKALDKASNMTVKGKTFVEQKAAKDAKEKAIADAQAAYDSAIAIRDAYNERQLAKVEDTAEGRKELIEKARRKFARLKSAVKDDAEAVSQLYRETIGSLLHRLYDSTGIDVTDTTPLTAEEYVASNLGAHSLNYEGTETSKGVKQETGLSREDFAKTQLLAADGKGTTIDALVHSLWENRPSNLESLDTQDIRNALIGVLNSGFKASEARNFVENIRIAQAENILEEQKRAQENAAYAEQHKAEPEAELKAKSDEKAELKAKSEAKLDNESSNESNDLSNESDNEKTNDKINDNINVPEDATDEAPLGAQRDESDLPFSAKENGKQQTTAERAADVEKNKVDDMKVVDNIVGQKTRKAFERLAKMMGANIQWQYSDKLGNGWIQETTDADGNVHRTIFITLDSSITEGAQFIFGHEMTHQIKNLNPAAYNELTQLVLDTYGSDAFDKAVDETMQRYSDAGFSGRARDYYAEEVVADAVGEMIRDLNLAHTLAMKMSHPLLAAIHEILQKIKLAFFGTEYSDVTKNIIRSIEQAYVKTAKGEVTNSETGEDVAFSLRQKPEPKKKGVGYKVFVLKDGKLYPPMVANPDGAATPVGVWLDADAAPIAGESKTGRPQVKQGGKGTQGGSGKLAYRPGWHLGVVPYAIQFNRKDAEGNKTLFPKNFVFAEVEYAADVDYQEEARQEGINPSGKYQHSLAGLKHLPTDGYYMYRTNPNPETDPWVITGAMKVNRILTRAEQAELVKNAGREPQQIQEGDIVTDDVVNSINQEIADAPKFSLKVYHGSGADFTEFDFDHMGEGAGSQAFGWGGYVTSSKKIGKDYARLGKETGGDYQYMGDTKLTSEQARVLAVFVGLPAYKEYSSMKEGVGAYIKSLRTLEQKGGFMAKHAGERIKVLESVLPKLDKVSRYDFAHKSRNLYEVDIPEDNGSNYIEFYEDATPEFKEQIKSVLANGLPSELKKMPEYKEAERKFYEENGTDESFEKSLIDDALFELERRKSNGDAYNALSVAVGDKLASKILSSLGYTGIKYPAGTIMGGAEENDTNYVIFKPEDMKITEHTKFSIKTYHGSQASFDKFDHSFMGSGEGAQAYGWGTYVSEVEGIAKAYAKQNANKHSRPQAYYKGEKLTNPTGIVIGVFNRMDVDDVSAKEAIARLIEEREKKMNATGYSTLRPRLQKEIDRLNELNPDDFEIRYPERNLYSVDIPDDTGRNYIGWDEPLGAAKIMRLPKVFKADGWEYKKVGQYDTYKIDGNENEVWLEPSLTTGKELYRDLTNALGSDKAASEFLSKAGFVGVKVIAQRNTGGNKEGKMNYVIFDENNAQITSHTKFSLKSKPVRFEAGKKLSDEEKKEVLSTLKDAYKVNGVPYHIEETAGGKEKRVYEPTADSYVMSDITNRPLRYYITLPDGRVAHPTEVYPNISDNEVKSSATKQGLLDEEVDQIVSAAIGNMKDIADNAKAVEVLTELQNLPHETHDVGYGLNHVRSYNYKTGIFTSDAAQAIDYVVRRMRRKEDVPAEIPAALKKAVDDSYGMVDNLIDGMSSTKFSLKDNQGNPLNQDGTLKLDKIKSVDELTDEDFTSAFRNVELPAIPKNVDAAIGANGKPVVIKKNIFEKNWNAHKFTPAESKKVLNDALYNTDLVGHTQPTKKPNHWVAIKLDDKSPITVLEVNDNKDNVEVVGWYTLDERNLGRIKRQAERNGGELIMLTPKDDKVESLSTPPLSSAAKIDNSSETAKENGEKVDVEAPKTFEEFLNHPSLKFSIKNEQQRKAAEDAYEYASKLRPNKSSQYALVDMSNPSNSPEYYEKKVLADRWRRFYNKAVHNELDDVYKDAWGNYKLFDLDRPFADQVNEVKGDVPNEFNAPDVVANKNADNESGAEYHEYKQDEPSSITYKDRYKAFKQREANREKTAGLRKERNEVEDVYKSKSEERVEYNKQLMKEYMDEHGLSSENDIPYDVWDNLRSKSFEKYQDELDSLFNKYKDLDKQIKAVAEPRFSLKDEKIKSVAEKFGVNEDDVAMYANAVEKGSTAEAARARANIKRYLLQANEDKISSFKELMKYTVPVNKALKENFGDLDAMIEEKRKQVEAERNAMEAARKRAQEEEEKRQKHLEELSLIPTDELDKRYMDAIGNNDESTAREMLDESARRKGYDDADSDYQGQGAWAAPSNPLYESDEERRADIENSPDVNLEDIALGYSLQPDDYFDNPRAYMNNTAYGLESAHVIKNALDAIKNGEKDVKVKVYRAVPTSVKEGKLRNGDWVTPSKKYAEMHGDNRLDGKYRIIEDEVPANQLWWDGNDTNEFGFDDGKEYRYKNAKNNRKLNDLITYDNKGNVIPPSKRFNSRKNDIRFSLAGERGAADIAEDLKSLNTPDEVDDAIKTAIEDMPSGWQMANRKMIHIAQALGENRKAEIAGEEPKFSLKDGSLIKAGTYFSGGGLVEEGLKGIIDPVVAVEYDEKISGVYRNNFGQHIVTADVRDVDPRELVKQIDGEVEYFHASPVCKNYSQAKSNHAEVELDKETAASTAEFINAIKPKVVTIENVKGYKDSDAMKTITDALDANGYTWDADVYNAADYGGYTNRERLIVRAVRDGKLPEKPKKMARKSGWYEAVADIIPTLTEKKNGVAPWMDIRLKADGIDWRNIDKPLYVMGSAYADGKVPHAFADELLPTLRTKSGDVIVMPDGKVYRAMGRVLARVSGVSDDYKMPFSENLSHIIIGNGIPTQLTEHVIAPLLQNTLRPTTHDDGNTKFSLRYDKFEHDLNQWKKDNNLPKDAQRPTIPQRNAGESAVDFLRRVDEYRKQMALWKTAPTYEQHLLSDDTALGEFNRELQRGSVLKRIAFQDSMLAIRKAQEAIMKEVGVDRLNMAEDAYTAENRSHGKGKNEFEEYNNEFLQPLRKAYHQMKKVLGDSYDNVRIYMMAKHGLERDAQMAFKKSLEADYEDVVQRSAAYKAYKGDMNRIINDSDLEFGRVDFTTWRQRDNALRVKYSPSYMDYRYDKNGIAYDYSGLSALFDGTDFEEAAHKLVKDIESKYVDETHDLWDATNSATKKILRDGYKAGMMSKDTYLYVRDMYSHYIPLRGWDGTTADQVWDYIGGGKGAFNQTLKTAHGRTSISDDPIAYIENMAESGILLNNKNWVKQHLMLLAQNHPTSLLTLSKAWYVKSTDANGNEEWIPATPQITSQMNSNQVKAAIDAFEKKMEQMAQTGDATQKRDGLNIAYPQTHSEEREHEVRVMKDGEEYVIYVNGDPQLAQAMNNTRAHRVREIQSGKLDRAAAWLGRKMAAAYTSLSPLFIPSNYFRDLTMTLASTAIREDAKYNYLLRKNLATSWNLGFMLRDYQNGKLREKVSNGNATPKEQMFYDFMMNGGETGFVSSLDVEDLKKKFKNDLKDLDRWKANPVKVGHTIMDSIEFLNRMIEDSNRFAVYMTSIQYGRSIDEAVNDAKDVTLNFNRKGTGEYGWQMIRNLYLFINPAVQSLQTLGALAKHHPFKFTAVTASWLTSGVLVPIVNAALMSLLGGDDDKDKYWQFTKWDRRNNLIMWVPFTHEYVKIPLAQEFRAFYGVGDMIASKIMGGELAEESWSQYAEDLLGQVVDMLPLDPTGYDGNIAVSLMPNAIRPVFELAFNVDFTGKPLFKETEYNKYDPNFTKAYVGTPDWLVRASKMVNSIGNDYPDVQQNSIDAFGDPRYNLNNPAVVDHVLSSYLGGAYTMGSQVLGVLTKSLNDPKEIKVADIPLFSKFVSNPDDRPVTKKQGDEFWDMKENHDRAANTLSKLKKQAKVDGDYSMLERFYGSEEYKQYKQDDVKVKKYEEDKKKERAEESGEEYRPHKLNAEDIYKAHATPKDDFEDLKLEQLYTKLNGFKSAYDLLVDTAPSQSDGYYNTNKAAIDAIDEISLDKQEISELKKGFLDDGKNAYNAEDMKQIRELRKKILAVLEKANKVVVANQKAKTKK